MAMKRLVSILIIMLSAVSVFAQHNHRTGYFLDGYTYKYKINPAFGADRGYFAIPVAGFTSASVETPIQLSGLLFPNGSDGELVTFLNPSVSVEDVMKAVKPMNPLNLNTDLSVISFGFNAKKSFHTVDLSLKADARANVPGSVFTWAKEIPNTLDISKLGARADASLELSYGYSRTIMENARFGFRVKMLAGLAKAQYMMDKLQLTAEQDKWTIQSAGSGYFAAPFPLVTEGADRHITGIEFPGFEKVIDDIIAARNLGAAIDLGFSIDLFNYLTLSASLTDIGFMTWNNASILESPDKPWTYEGFDAIGDDDVTIKSQLKVFGEELIDLTYPMVIAEGARKVEMLSMTAHVGAEFRMPFWQRLSVGALGTARVDGPYTWFEGRASLNCALFRWFSFSGSYAYSNFGESYGAALNIHPKGMNLFIGLDSFKPLLDMSVQHVPMDSFNTNLTFGLNIAFGKYRGRYPKRD
jgi:hypothetical protein